jgi:hypothetical protein
VISSSLIVADSLKIKVAIAGKLDSLKFFYKLNDVWTFWKTIAGNSVDQYNETEYNLPIFTSQYQMTDVKVESYPDTTNWIRELTVLDNASMIKDRRICASISAGIVKSGWAIDLGCGWAPCAGLHKGSTTLKTIVTADTFYYQETVQQYFIPTCEDGGGIEVDYDPPLGVGTVDGKFPFSKDGWTYSLEYYPVSQFLQSEEAKIVGTYEGTPYTLIDGLSTYSLSGTSWGNPDQIFVKYNYSFPTAQKYFEVLLRSPWPVVIAFNLLEPLDLTVYSDEEPIDLGIYTEKENIRDYFRGIHPKIRKF